MHKKNIKNPLNGIQYELNQILYSFLNGGFSAPGYLLFPLHGGVSKEIRLKIANLFSAIRNIDGEENFDFSFSLGSLGKLGAMPWNSSKCAALISSLYSDFEKNKKTSKISKIIEIPESNVLEDNDYTGDYLRPVLELKKFSETKLRDYVLDIYVHGSLSTLDYVEGWSDFDTLAVIKKEAVLDRKMLLKLRALLYMSKKYFYRVDPLQHHGHLIISEFDLDYYCQTMFPLALFEYSKSVLNGQKLEFRLRNSDHENKLKYLWFIDYFRNFYKNPKKNLGSYDLKFHLHAITLFPAMYLQAKGVYLYKKFSFGAARKYFDKSSWEIIDYVSDIRKKWKQPKIIGLSGLYSNINPLLAYQLNSKYWDAAQKIRELNSIDIKKLAEGSGLLAEQASPA